jgi:hypothetical protein
MAAMLFFITPAALLLGLGAFITEYFNFWGWDL